MLFVFALMFCFSTVCGQNTLALPEVFSFSKQSYQAGLQNWAFSQGQDGVVYIANNEGLLVFDGKSWNLYPLPNRTIVRSVYQDDAGKIFVGGQDELGYFSPSKNGILEYHSLLDRLPPDKHQFGDIWNIVASENRVFFRATAYIFVLELNRFQVYPAPFEWGFLGKSHQAVYAADYRTGLRIFRNNQWQVLPTNALKPEMVVTGMVDLDHEKSVITTFRNGLFLLAGQKVTPIQADIQPMLRSNHIYSAARVNDNLVALGTTAAGLLLVDTTWKLVQQFGKKEGLQNENVLAVYCDAQQNIWLGLDNGIDLVAQGTAVKQVDPGATGNSGYTTAIFNQQLYVGTSNGLYAANMGTLPDISYSRHPFRAVSQTDGQVWNLKVWQNQLLMAHHEGAATIENLNSKWWSRLPGFWDFLPYPSTDHWNDSLLTGTYKGLIFWGLSAKIPRQLLSGIPNFTESSRYLAIDSLRQIWVSHPYHGIFKITGISKSAPVVHYGPNKGLPSLLNNHIFQIKGQILAATQQGVYRFQQKTDRFEPDPFYNQWLGTQSIRFLKEDTQGNIWYVHEKEMGVLDLANAKPRVIKIPELTNRLLSGFENLYAYNAQNIFVSAEKGILHINYEKYKSTVSTVSVLISQVKLFGEADSLLYGGFGPQADRPKLNPVWNRIRFAYSSPQVVLSNYLEYSCRLQGYETAWSNWGNTTDKEYTNLPAGKYKFEVRVRYLTDSPSATTAFSFEILPPWYQTVWARMLYLFCFIGALFAYYQYQQNRLKQQQRKHQQEQQHLKYVHELEMTKSEKELTELRNENLEKEIRFKNAELASSAMHLVKKGELISSLRHELNQMLDKPGEPAPNQREIRKMVRSLIAEEQADGDWENFSKHFDSVHSNFLENIKKIYPSLSQNDLKLCAYLRINLSTKEIAQLLNISVRGVELSRYRLRKKLGVPAGAILIDFLLAVHQGSPASSNSIHTGA